MLSPEEFFKENYPKSAEKIKKAGIKNENIFNLNSLYKFGETYADYCISYKSQSK